jgi:hypothetical protein
MINIKIEGLEDTINKIKSIAFINDSELDGIVKKAALPLVQKIKQNYISRGHKKTGALVNSIEAFQRKRKGRNDPYFTYYVGPRYTGGKNSLFSYGGNAAHLLEYGTAERYRANVKAGGVGRSQGLSKVYGAKFSTGKVMKPTIGVLRQSEDEYSNAGKAFLKAQVTSLLMDKAKQKGLAA